MATNAVLGKRGRDDAGGLDYSQPIPYPYTKEIVEAMRLRILQLENELRAVKKQKTTASTQQTTLNAFTGQAGPSTASQPVVDAKAIKTRKKNLFDAIKKAAKGEKYQNKTITLKVEEHFNQNDFESVFGNSGLLIQPTATNKPKSNVWIRHYNSQSDLAALFGDSWKPDQLKGHQWTIGGLHGKSQKLPNAVPLLIHNMEVQWSKNQEKATLKIYISEEDTESTMLKPGWFIMPI